MKISKQYIGYYAKYSLFNLKGSKSKVTKIELRIKSVFQWGFSNSICYAEQYKQKVIQNKKCMKLTMGPTSDSMTSMPYHFHRWVSAWCSVSLAGRTVAQFGFFVSSWLSLSWEPLSLFPGSMLIYLIISQWWYIGYVRKPPRELNIFFVWHQQNLGLIFGSIINLNPSVFGIAF